jgi:hypothetical protein
MARTSESAHSYHGTYTTVLESRKAFMVLNHAISGVRVVSIAERKRQLIVICTCRARE